MNDICNMIELHFTVLHNMYLLYQLIFFTHTPTHNDSSTHIALFSRCTRLILIRMHKHNNCHVYS